VSYTFLLYIHILSSTLLFGTGLGTAFHGWMAHRSRDVAAIAVVSRNVVLTDWIFTAPSVIIQPVTGIIMAARAGFSLTTPWLLTAIILYLLIGACWLPVVWLQTAMRRVAETAYRGDETLPPIYYVYARLWFLLGWPAFIGVLAVFYLMLFKPDFSF
jgi:uncharacterized membrane protein